MSKILILSRLPLAARAAVIAGALVVVAAAPAAAATRPTRTVYEPHSFVIPAGQGCSFDVRGVPTSGHEAQTVFSDTEWMNQIHVKGYYENMDTGAIYWVNDTWSERDVYDPTTNIDVVTTSGQVDTMFWPGDVGPFGPVTTATMYRFTGTTTNTVDFNLNRTVAFSWSGRVTDLCAALS